MITAMEHFKMLLGNSKEWLANELVAEQNRKHELITVILDLKKRVRAAAIQLVVLVNSNGVGGAGGDA